MHSSPGDLAVWSVDFVLDFDGWIIRSSAPAAGDPGVWTSVWIFELAEDGHLLLFICLSGPLFFFLCGPSDRDEGFLLLHPPA
ncbi:hypothetical protein TNIN_483611 [Trichonephila inaurata madagascariensis]|uniref:Uncharacterized protein n=1 Tax=Trichonephila inaurata madagascariensis TaxID=2747483 RepID=A0A8X6M5Q3_9ARAC|nr:hypothetical protein TNIN_483611 [Trichonephila inaurata madagascariensis]